MEIDRSGQEREKMEREYYGSERKGKKGNDEREGERKGERKET